MIDFAKRVRVPPHGDGDARKRVKRRTRWRADESMCERGAGDGGGPARASVSARSGCEHAKGVLDSHFPPRLARYSHALTAVAPGLVPGTHRHQRAMGATPCLHPPGRKRRTPDRGDIYCGQRVGLANKSGTTAFGEARRRNLHRAAGNDEDVRASPAA